MKFKIFVVVWIWCLTGMVIYLDVNRQSLERDLAQCQADLTADKATPTPTPTPTPMAEEWCDPSARKRGGHHGH